MTALTEDAFKRAVKYFDTYSQFQNFPTDKAERINALKGYFDRGAIMMNRQQKAEIISRLERLLNHIKELTMPDEQKKWDAFTEPMGLLGSEQGIQATAHYTASLLFHPDEKHMILNIGCRQHICHNKAEVLKNVEKEITEIIENKKRQKRAFARRQKLFKATAAREKKKKLLATSEKKLKPTPEEPSLIPEPEDPSSTALPPEEPTEE